MIATTELISLFWTNLEAHCFDCFLGESVEKDWKQWASRCFQNIENSELSDSSKI